MQSSDCSQFGVYQISLAATPNQYFIAPDNYVPDSTYSFDVSIACSINDCPTITATIPSSIMEYGVYPLNSPTAYTLGPSLSVNNCLVPDFDIVNDDGSAIDNSAFSYDKSMNVFTINTQNTQLAGEYPMKLVKDGITQSEFSVILNDSSSIDDLSSIIDSNSIDDCPTITATIPSSVIEYEVYPSNSPIMYALGPSLSVNKCLVPDFDIVNDDGSAIDNSAFSYDKSMNVFTINTQNTQLAGEYPMKLVNDGMTQSEFSVILNDYCETPTVTSTEQVNPDDYHFSGAVTFELNKFQVTPVECFIVYTCLMVEGPVEYDLCNFTDEKTISSFNPGSGEYYFTSDD